MGHDAAGEQNVTDEARQLAGSTLRGKPPHLKAVAYRLLGSRDEADDAVQESWIKLSRSDPAKVENLTGLLTTIVARICLDMLRFKEPGQKILSGPRSPNR
jgi:DNA-directed RNA polymerase specialized sigma24 family protein